MDNGEKTEVFKTKLLNRLYGSAQTECGEAHCPDSTPVTAVHSQPVPAEDRTQKLYTAALPAVWPPPINTECPDEPQDAEDVTSSSSSSTASEEEHRFRKRKRRRNKRNASNMSQTQGNEKHVNIKRNVPLDLTKNQKRKLKKKRRKEKMKQNELSGSKNTEFVYVGPNKETETSTVDNG